MSDALTPSSLILASRNRPALLVAAVESILAGEALPSELIIVDQSDTANEHLGELATRCAAIRYVWSPSRGLSRANNLGIATAAHDVLVFTHDDVLVERTWYARLVRALIREGRTAVVTGGVHATAPQIPHGFAPSVNESTRAATYAGRIGMDVLYPMNMAMHRSVVDSVGGFDPRLGPGTAFPAAEDNDLGFRLLEAGHRIVFEPSAVVHHRAWRPRSEYRRLRYGYGRGQGAYYAKHLKVTDPYMLRRLLADLGQRVSRLPANAVRDRRRAFGDLAYVRGVLTGLIAWKRQEFRAARVGADARRP